MNYERKTEILTMMQLSVINWWVIRGWIVTNVHYVYKNGKKYIKCDNYHTSDLIRIRYKKSKEGGSK